MILKYINEVRLFQILFEDLDFYNDDVKQTLLSYIDKYIKYKNISSHELKINYESFLKQYSKDAQFYLKNNKYPALSSDYNYPITREEYDIFLLLSTVLTQHRYDIMCEINQSLLGSKSALIIGSGVGLEIELIKESYNFIDAYDIELDKFCYSNHTEVSFYEKEFKSNEIQQYNDIYIVELLEHVSEPYTLIKDAVEVLTSDGRIIITLAVNIPQFDHIINFNDTFFRMSDYPLSVNYRSGKEIVHTSQRLIRKNQNRIPKDIEPAENNPMGTVEVFGGNSLGVQLTKISDWIKIGIEERDLAFENFAVRFH